jgi:hypothetical protein
MRRPGRIEVARQQLTFVFIIKESESEGGGASASVPPACLSVIIMNRIPFPTISLKKSNKGRPMFEIRRIDIFDKSKGRLVVDNLTIIVISISSVIA